MSTMTIEPPTDQSTVYVNGENIQEVIDSLDEDLANIQANEMNGQYVRIGTVFNVVLDVRNKLTNLIQVDKG